MDDRLLKEYTREVIKELKLSLFPKGPFTAAAEKLTNWGERTGTEFIRAKHSKDREFSNLESLDLLETKKIIRSIESSQKNELDDAAEKYMQGISSISNEDEELSSQGQKQIKQSIYKMYASFAKRLAKRKGLYSDSEEPDDNKMKEVYSIVHDSALEEMKDELNRRYQEIKDDYESSKREEKEDSESSS